MADANNQVQNLLNEFKAVNEKARDYLKEVDKKIVELDMKYAQDIVNNHANILKAAKTVLQNKRKNKF